MIIRAMRAVPFAAFAVASVLWAARAPDGRKPFELSLDLTPAALGHALTKWPHMASIAFLYALALLATGSRRPLLAAGLVFATGAAWELVQTTVVGHNARLADLLPNAVALVLCVGATRLVRAPTARYEQARSLKS